MKKTCSNKKKITSIIIIILIVIILISIILFLLFPKRNSNYYETSTFIVVPNSNKFKNKIIASYSEYQDLIKESNSKETLTEQDFKKNKYLALFLLKNSCSEEIEKVILKENTNSKVKIQVNVNLRCGYCTLENYLYLIPLNKRTDTSSKIEITNKTKKVEDCELYTIDKPIIYLYPETTKEVNVKLGREENIIRSYPKYTDGWHVLAEPSGKLTDLKTNKELYSLYWEGKMNNKKDYNDGFIVKKTDLVSFFEEKLTILGLSYREQEEFIIYWIPQLDDNDYTFIRFMSEEEIQEGMPLEVTPAPDNTIRVWMQYKKVDSTYKTHEQVLKSPSRTGFVLVEWGGTQIK